MDALECIRTRRSRPRLADPAPDEDTVRELIELAVAAPDHGSLRPWRFVVVRGSGRQRLGEVFAEAHRAREPAADVGAIEKTTAKPLRAPVIISVICRPVRPEDAPEGKSIPIWEQEAAVAAAAQNLCLAAHALGFASMWRTGWYGDAPEVRRALGMGAAERLIGWIYLGTPAERAVLPSRRPALREGSIETFG